MSVSLREVTPEAPGATVLRLAKHAARNFDDWGALERGDYVGVACLAFYEAAARWTGEGSFGGYALRCMDGAVRELRRAEVRQQTGWLRRARPSSKDVRALSRRVGEGGNSASLEAHTRRRASRREHNRTYYYRHVGLQACQGCGALVERGHGARRCDACVSPHVRYMRLWRVRKRESEAPEVACGVQCSRSAPRSWRRPSPPTPC